ncbi:hypothetical protein GIB67_043188 [Kingdonia uniflora]|uniref:Uncharacterized protein n=1 Tax=Kingdonia uniflora TaxID=39325 RepID=A0A7J7NJH5_9MAGN|nr:hypothetical protein GIB67_043188 [Kingdonia uniflora]
MTKDEAKYTLHSHHNLEAIVFASYFRSMGLFFNDQLGGGNEELLPRGNTTIVARGAGISQFIAGYTFLSQSCAHEHLGESGF